MNLNKTGLMTALFLGCLLLAAAPAQAALNWYQWNAGNGNWSIPSNWVPYGTIPHLVGDAALITGNVTVGLDIPIELGGLQVDAGNSVVFQERVSPPDPTTITFASGAVVTNDGTIRLTDIPNNSHISSYGAVTFTGSGELVMESWLRNELSSLGPYTNDSNHIIRGTGRILSNITNKGKIIADNGLLTVLNVVVTNQGDGILSAHGSGNVLDLKGAWCTGGQFNPEKGLIRLSDNAGLQNAHIWPGIVEITGSYGGYLNQNIILDPGTEMTVISGSSLGLGSNAMVTNNGLIRLDSASGQAKMQIGDWQTVTLTGSGGLDMIGGSDGLLTGSKGSLVNDTGHTIRGSGSIAVATTNKGTILVDDQREMRLEQPVTGDGLVKVANGGTLSFSSDLQCGRMEVWDTATLVLNTNNLQVLGGGLFLSDDSALQVNAGRTLDLKSDLILCMKKTANWNWNAGTTLQLSGSGASQQFLEVGGIDHGASSEGFSSNFNLVHLALSGTGTYVNLMDDIYNLSDDPEALYVESLTVPEGTTLNLNRLHLYTYYPDSTTVYRVVGGDDAKFGSGRIIDRSLVPCVVPTAITPLLLDD